MDFHIGSLCRGLSSVGSKESDLVEPTARRNANVFIKHLLRVRVLGFVRLDAENMINKQSQM